MRRVPRWLFLGAVACGGNETAPSESVPDGGVMDAPSGPGPVDAGPAVKPGAIQIDPSDRMGALPLLGFNMTPFANGQGLMTDDGRYVPRVHEGVVTIGADWLRFPGGTFSEFFDWRNVIGPVATRTGFHAFTLLPEKYVFGLDEAARLAEEMGGRLLCVINVNLSAHVAADWVEYMNAPVGKNPNGGTEWARVRAANGHPAPYGVVFWELSNETGNNRVWPRWDPDVDPASPDFTLASGPFDAKSQTLTMHGGQQAFHGYQAVTKNTWKYDHPNLKFDASAGQVRYTKLAPVMRASLAVRVGTSPATAVAWTMVSSFETANPTSTVFTFDEQEGAITFGDGIHGAIPPAGAFAYTDFTFVADGLVQIRDAMQAVDPTIKVSSSFAFTPGQMRKDKTLAFDGLQLHTIEAQTDAYPSDPYSNMLSRAWGTVRNLLETTLENTADVGLPAIGSEFHPWQDAYDANTNYRNTSIGAVGLALNYAMTMEHGDRMPIVGPNYLLIADILRESAVDPREGIPHAEAWAEKLLREYTADARVKVTSPALGGESLTYFRDKQGTMPATTMVPKLVVTASVSSDNRELDVFVVNSTKEESVTTTLGIESPLFYADDLTSIHQVAGPTPTTENTHASPEAVTMKALALPAKGQGNVPFTFPPLSITGFRFRH